MKFLSNPIIQFTISTSGVVIAVAIALGFVLSNTMTQRAMHQHIKIYPEIINNILLSNQDIIDSLAQNQNIQVNGHEAKTLKKLLNFDTIFRIKLWDLKGRIIWSNKLDIIGEQFPDNIDFLIAKKGKAHYAIDYPRSKNAMSNGSDNSAAINENTSEKNSDIILEIYIPIKAGKHVVGVIELYEEADKLFQNIQKDNAIIWLLVCAAGAIAYLLQFFIFLKAHNNQKTTNENLNSTLDVIISSLAQQAEIRDVDTGHHLERTSNYVQLIAKHLKKTNQYKEYLSNQYIIDLVKSAPLHDIGKVGIPDRILQKPGKLTKEEFTLMEKHCEYGACLLKSADAKLTFQSFLKIAIQIALHHHEKWDGTGYPHKLKGEEIPLSARIMAIADVYDALRSDRCYKKAFSHEKSVEIIKQGSGSHFDPGIVDAFIALKDEFKKISTSLAG